MAQTPPADNNQPSWTQRYFSGYFKNLASGLGSCFQHEAWEEQLLDRLRVNLRPASMVGLAFRSSSSTTTTKSTRAI